MEIVAHVQTHVGWKINMMENLYFYLNKKQKQTQEQARI
jgi:hypothetical protein